VVGLVDGVRRQHQHSERRNKSGAEAHSEAGRESHSSSILSSMAVIHAMAASQSNSICGSSLM
jgi:hypothetical protein